LIYTGALLLIFVDKYKKHGKKIPWDFGELKSFLLCSRKKFRIEADMATCKRP
jgi:hypothetical protein